MNNNNLKELIGTEIEFRTLDKKMVEMGYYSISTENKEVVNECKEECKLIYTSTETNEAEVEISFKIILNNSEDEDDKAFYLHVENIVPFKKEGEKN